MSITAMKQALEALELSEPAYMQECYARHNDAITALRAAISEQEKCEPVAWMHEQGNACFAGSITGIKGYHRPLYTHPAPVPTGWQLVPVEPTDEMIYAVCKLKDERILRLYHGESCNRGIRQAYLEEYKVVLAAAPKPGEMK